MQACGIVSVFGLMKADRPRNNGHNIVSAVHSTYRTELITYDGLRTIKDCHGRR